MNNMDLILMQKLFRLGLIQPLIFLKMCTSYEIYEMNERQKCPGCCSFVTDFNSKCGRGSNDLAFAVPQNVFRV